jgi:hypothetical protein
MLEIVREELTVKDVRFLVPRWTGIATLSAPPRTYPFHWERVFGYA